MRRQLVAPAFGIVVLLFGVSVSAQTARPERPYRGLFASGTGDTGQLLTAQLSVGGGFDDDLLANARGTGGVSSAASEGGVLGQVAGSLAYSLEAGRVSFSASAGTSGRYYPSEGGQIIRGSHGQMSLDTSFTESTSLSVSAGVSHQPYVFQALFPAGPDPQATDAPVPDLDLVVGQDPYIAYDGTVGISQQLTRRSSLSGSFGFRSSEGATGFGNFDNRTVAASYTYSMAKGLNLRAGYGYGKARYADGQTVPHHGIDAGADYNRALSISRRTTVSFGTGSAASHVDEQLQYILTGSAKLNHEMGRTWNVFASYGRQFLLHEAWRDPVVSDGLAVGIGGLISRRLQFDAQMRASLGTVGVTGGSPGYDTANGSASLGFALSRLVNMGLTYSYYRHRFDAGVLLPSGVPPIFDRHTVSANLTVWAPVFQRARRN
jgi:hypothetical protein